jgi:hypothetical protein
MKPSRAVPATSSLPLQMALYFNIIVSIIFFLFVTSVHIHKVAAPCFLVLVHRLHPMGAVLQRYNFQYDRYMRILVPVFIAGYSVCEPLRLYLGYSGNLKEKVAVAFCQSLRGSFHARCSLFGLVCVASDPKLICICSSDVLSCRTARCLPVFRSNSKATD